MLRTIKRNILKEKLKIKGIEKINKRFSEFWMQLRIKAIKRQQNQGIYRKDKDPHVIYWLKQHQGKGKARRIQAVY